MQKRDSLVLYSASDLVTFAECEHATTLDRVHLDTPLPFAEDDDQARLIQNKGLEHEAAYLEVLRNRGEVADIRATTRSHDQAVTATLAAMESGLPYIYQATFQSGEFIGLADFLERVPRPSRLGNFSYEVSDTKLARSAKGKFIIQLAYYSDLLAQAQSLVPTSMHVVLGDRTVKSFRYPDFARYVQSIKSRFIARMRCGQAQTYPEPCGRCELCRWREVCKERWVADDHLSQVANITRVQSKKLKDSGVTTLAALARLPDGASVPRIAPETLNRLRHQAALQLAKREDGDNHCDLLPIEQNGSRGFARLPCPDQGDLFFDMEGDPHEEGGLEYLFGVYYFNEGTAKFLPFWAHNRNEERLAFEQFVDFVAERLQRFPEAHIYHYNHYEPTALKRLMSLHGTREAEVDNLLRRGRFVDLYRVVFEAIRVSEPAYSIKNLEHFYMKARDGDVTNAGASIVYYERWKETQEAGILQEIQEYNQIDCESTYLLREWLLSMRPVGLPWGGLPADTADNESIPALTGAEARLVPYREELVDKLPTARAIWTDEQRQRELTYQLLDFYRRAAKPVWWAHFARQDMTDEELLEDVECIACLELDATCPPFDDKRSVVYTYRYPDQEFKLKDGGSCVRIDTLEEFREVSIDEDSRRVRLRYAKSRGRLPNKLALGPGRPINSDVKTEALFRFADSVVAGSSSYPSIEALLRRDLPNLRDRSQGDPIINSDNEVEQATEAIAELDGSYLVIQGPPGAGKTYLGSRVIVALLARGFRIGVTSLSHKAINNLLGAVEEAAIDEGVRFAGAKRASKGNEDSYFEGRCIRSVESNGDIAIGGYQLVAGTAWCFADAALDSKFDVLFIDEAGQVSLADLVATGTSARNLVLLGDQMQLGQPVQGVHPGQSGNSALNFLLNGYATIPPERGIFLAHTRRLHPSICQFISDAVYDGRLLPDPSNQERELVLNEDHHKFLTSAGIRFIPVDHDECSQQSVEEAALVKVLYDSLTKQRYRTKEGEVRPIEPDNILVVAPYNMQVNLLKRTLIPKARVGTVDKFQGQEAEIVIVSMTTSSGDYLPRFIEFLYSKNRLNVAISRAKSLALVIANPRLLSISCHTPEQMALVNTLCWVRDYSMS